MSFLIVILFVAGSIGLIVVACNVKDDYQSEQDWEKAIIELERLHGMLSHVLDGIENKNNNHNEMKSRKAWKEMIKLERVDGQWYEVDGDTQKPVNIDTVVKRVEECNVIPYLRIYELRNGDMVVLSKQIVKSKLRIGDRWEQYPFMTCVRKIYAPHRWWQFWKWRKLAGYEMRYWKE